MSTWKSYKLNIKHKMVNGIVLNVPVTRKARTENEAIRLAWKKLEGWPARYGEILSITVSRG